MQAFENSIPQKGTFIPRTPSSQILSTVVCASAAADILMNQRYHPKELNQIRSVIERNQQKPDEFTHGMWVTFGTAYLQMDKRGTLVSDYLRQFQGHELSSREIPRPGSRIPGSAPDGQEDLSWVTAEVNPRSYNNQFAPSPELRDHLRDVATRIGRSVRADFQFQAALNSLRSADYTPLRDPCAKNVARYLFVTQLMMARLLSSSTGIHEDGSKTTCHYGLLGTLSNQLLAYQTKIMVRELLGDDLLLQSGHRLTRELDQAFMRHGRFRPAEMDAKLSNFLEHETNQADFQRRALLLLFPAAVKDASLKETVRQFTAREVFFGRDNHGARPDFPVFVMNTAPQADRVYAGLHVDPGGRDRLDLFRIPDESRTMSTGGNLLISLTTVSHDQLVVADSPCFAALESADLSVPDESDGLERLLHIKNVFLQRLEMAWEFCPLAFTKMKEGSNPSLSLIREGIFIHFKHPDAATVLDDLLEDDTPEPSIPVTMYLGVAEDNVELLFDLRPPGSPYEICGREAELPAEKEKKELSRLLYQIPTFGEFFDVLRRDFDTVMTNHGKGSHKGLERGGYYFALSRRFRAETEPLAHQVALAAIKSLRIPFKDFMQVLKDVKS